MVASLPPICRGVPGRCGAALVLTSRLSQQRHVPIPGHCTVPKAPSRGVRSLVPMKAFGARQWSMRAQYKGRATEEGAPKTPYEKAA